MDFKEKAKILSAYLNRNRIILINSEFATQKKDGKSSLVESGFR